jgi:hypothetical protein
MTTTISYDKQNKYACITINNKQNILYNATIKRTGDVLKISGTQIFVDLGHGYEFGTGDVDEAHEAFIKTKIVGWFNKRTIKYTDGWHLLKFRTDKIYTFNCEHIFVERDLSELLEIKLLKEANEYDASKVVKDESN